MTLKVVEETSERLVFKSSGLTLLVHMSLLTFMAAAVTVSLTFFLHRYLGLVAVVFITLPGTLCVFCGFFGCANARTFIFSFDHTQGQFTASAGGVSLSRSLREVRLVYIERESSGNGLFSGEAPNYGLALLFPDGQRFRLESGISATGSGRGPEDLQAAGEKIRVFLNLSQINLPLLDISAAMKEDSRENRVQSEDRGSLSRWMACQGMSPHYEPPLSRYDWVDAPVGVADLPAPVGMLGSAGLAAALSERWATSSLSAAGVSFHPGLGPVVVGRPQPSGQRQIQVAVPEGSPGQAITVTAPDGSQVTAMVPVDMRPGETMILQY